MRNMLLNYGLKSFLNTESKLASAVPLVKPAFKHLYICLGSVSILRVSGIMFSTFLKYISWITYFLLLKMEALF